MGDAFKRWWGRRVAAWHAFAGTYFGPWVVRFLAIPPVLYATLLFIQSIDSVFGLPSWIHNLFPISKWAPPVIVAWVIAASFFLISLAVAQHVSARLMVSAAEREKDLAVLRLEIKDMEMRLNAEMSKAELAARMQEPAKETAAKLAIAEKECERLQAKIAAFVERSASISNEERMTLSKGCLRRAVDELREDLQSGGAGVCSSTRNAIRAGQIVLRHEYQNEWHKHFRELANPELRQQLRAMDVFIDSLIIEQLRDFARSDVEDRSLYVMRG